MKVLAITNMFPTAAEPASGTFVEQQVAGLARLGIDVAVLLVDRASRGMAAYLGVPALVRQRIAAGNPDLVHVMYGGVLADLVTMTVTDRPVVVTFHGSDLLGEQLARPVRRLIAGVGVQSSYRAAKRAAGVVVVAEALARRLLTRLDRGRIRVIPCGIDLDRFSPLDPLAARRQLGWTHDRFHVLFNAGGDDPVKRPALARAAIERLNARGVPAELHEMHGVPNDRVAIWLSASDALLLTSLHEGSPTIVKEALACNLPVVSVDVGDVRDRIAGIAGCYLAAADPDDLAARLAQVRTDGRRLQARERISELSLESTAARLAAFYDELMATGAAADRARNASARCGVLPRDHAGASQ